MSEKKEGKKSGNEEIDLLDLLNSFGKTVSKWWRTIVKGFLASLVFIIKRWLPIGLSIVLGVSVSYLFKISAGSIYTSDLVLKGNSVTSAEMYQYFKRLNTLTIEKNSGAIADVLAIDSIMAENIIDLNVHWIMDVNNDSIPDYIDFTQNQKLNDTSNYEIRMQDQVNIRIKTREEQDLKTVSKGILSFIESDSLFQQRNRLRLKQYRDLISRLDYDILQLDSLQKIKYYEETRENISKDGGQMVFLQQQNTQLVYGDIHTLYKTKQLLEYELSLNNNIVTMLSDFSVPEKIAVQSGFYVRNIIPIILLITLLILILLANRKRLTEWFRKYE